MLKPEKYDEIPKATLAGLERYRDMKYPTGGFLESVLSNQLGESVARADGQNTEVLCTIVTWVYNNLPAESWGSPEKYRAWLDSRVEDSHAKPSLSGTGECDVENDPVVKVLKEMCSSEYAKLRAGGKE